MKTAKWNYKKITYLVSLCVILLWVILGAGTSLAWFTDTSRDVKNIFHVAEFDLKVSHRTEHGWYEVIDGETEIFDDEALYEPGYVQVVRLKVENKGELPFSFKTAVSVADYTVATNVFGSQFNLQDHLKFGVVTADTEQALDAMIADRSMAQAAAQMPLNNYSSDAAVLPEDGTKYMALIVQMPEEVGNEANYRGTDVPKVELGVIVTAEQIAQ